MNITVIHKRDQTGDEQAIPYPQVYVGRPSPLGNPWAIGRDGTREEVIANYKDWLHHTMEYAPQDNVVRKEMYRLWDMAIANEGLVIVCWCKPQDCHGDVIADWIRAEDNAMYEYFAKQMEIEDRPMTQPNTTTNFGALRNTMRVIKQHRRYLASVDCANDKFPIDICDVLEWNKGWSDELTQFEWNIVKAHLPS